MNNIITTLIISWILLLNGCGNDDNTANNDRVENPNTTEKTQSLSQQKTKTSTPIAVTSNEPSEPQFNREQVLADYAQTPLTILDVSERNKDGRNSIAITLSVPLDPALNHQKYFNVSAAKQGAVEGAWVLSNSGKTIWFPYVEPNSAYDITVYQGLTAANGKRLNKTQHNNVKTSELQPSVNFDTTGAFLTQGLGNGLPVVTVNVAEVDINFYKIETSKQQSFLQQISNRRRYWAIDRITQFGDLVYTGRYALDAPKNTRVKRSIDIEGISQLKKSGIYLAVMTEAGTYKKHQMMWFSVTDIGLHARFYDNQLDVYASSLKTGKALENVNISFVNKKGEILQQSLTSPDGQASFAKGLSRGQLIIAQHDQDLSVIEMHKPALDLSEFDLGLRPSKPQELFIYAPRDLYRPGEVIDFNALLRDADGQLTATRTLNVTIKSPNGTQVKTFKWQGNEQNYYHYLWQIPSSAAVGNWQLQVNNISSKSSVYHFKVEEFLPERVKLTFDPNNQLNRPQVNKYGTFDIKILGEYLYGAPASGNRVSTQVNTTLWRNPVESLPMFEFGDIRQTEYTKRFNIDDISLDENGYGKLSYEGDWGQLVSPLKVMFISSLYETGGRPVSRTFSGLVWPSKTLLGIRSSFGDKNPEANSKVSFDIVRSSIDGVKHVARNVDVKLIREDRRYFWVYSEARGWHYEWNDNEFVELTASIDINQGEHSTVEFPVAWGNYRLEVRDPTNQLFTSTRFYAGRNWYENWKKSQSGSGAARPDKITLALDKGAYRANETVNVNVVPPQAGEAIIMVEGDKPLWLKRQYIPAEGAIIAIPVSSDWTQHNLYISAVVLQPAERLKSLTPKRSFGLIHLPLERNHRKLNIAFDVVEKALPNKTLPVKISVTSNNENPHSQQDTQGELIKPQQVFVTLSAVDVGVLSISNFDTPDPFDAFFGQRRYSVDSRDVYNKVIEISQADNARLRFGGDRDLTRGGQAPQSDVQIVSLFSGLVTLNELGEATIPLAIPDFNGQLRLMALAFSDKEFGHAEQEVTIADKIVTQIAMPRFLAMGDHTTVALDVSNLSDFTQVLDVSLIATGPVKAQNKPQQITLKKGEKTTLRYAIEATGFSGNALFTLNIKGDNLEDDIARDWSLGLRPPYPALLTQTQKILNTGETLALDKTLIDSLHQETVQAAISVSSKANIDLQSQLNQLLRYPYGCLEQTSSRVYPLIYATSDKQRLMGLNSVNESMRIDMINKGVERLATLQLNNGGYGLWSNKSSEEHWLTAYVADFLVNARNMGVNVPDDMYAKTLKRLRRYVNRSNKMFNERWSQDANHYNFAYKAYSAYVLANLNQVPLGTLRSLARHHSSQARTGLSQLHLAIALLKMGDSKLGNKILLDALSNLPQKRKEYWGDYGSHIRDLAMMIHLMLKHELAENKAIELSYTLADIINQRQYLSTQERNALFLAGLSLKSVEGHVWSANLLIGAAKTQINQTIAYQHTLNAEAINQTVELTSTHDQPLLASMRVSGYRKTPPQASANGLSIQRNWLTLKGEEAELSQVQVGDLFIVHLYITAEQRTPDALVIDMLPAGFELENQNLAHAIKLDDIKIEGKNIDQWQQYNPPKHQEYRDDRYVAAVEVRKHNAVNLFYMVRAVTPGVYKVPSPLIEDMYRPEIRGIGDTSGDINIVQK
ncbi:alpha-2-macroglobulin family protein [Algibacillus agarilyticus]|uniref:alpha-2-macroglobulin family protein n=1 Tax=Algibacillus agarilyticus TaxID=2234133 RepID=UPI000DD0AC7B|nr:alpha-2-macroglobulin [Algibacillus agarilyticus]